MLLERPKPSAGFHALVLVFTDGPDFIPQPFAARADAERVGPRRYIGRALAKLEGAPFRSALREVSRQFRVKLPL